MQDRTPVYMLSMVGIVAVVAIFVMLTSGSGATSDDTSGNADFANSGFTGNVVYEGSGAASTFSINNFGKVFMTLFLVGIAGYMYFRAD